MEPTVSVITPVQQHLADLRAKRLAAIVATIPAAAPDRYRNACQAYARVAVAQFGRRGLARVHWPWLETPMDRTYRGKSTRPTPIKG